jgi:diguanylate cyclase (GGDEF)-like protein
MAPHFAAPALPGAALAFRRMIARCRTAARRARAGGSVLLVLGGPVGGVLTGMLAGASTPAAAQVPPATVAQRLRFRHLGVDDGLPSSLVTAVRQDRRGFLWIGTSRGVSRYDGHHFRTYDHRPGDPTTLPADHVAQVYVDRSDIVWAVTSGGLSRYDATLDRFVTLMTGTGSAAPEGGRPATGTVTSVVEDAAGTLWVGTSVGLHRVNRVTGEATRFPIVSPRGDSVHVTSLYEDRSGGLWVGAQGAVYRVDRTRSSAPRYYPLVPEETRVTEAAEDTAGNVWIATEGAGVMRADVGTATLRVFRHDARDPYSLGRDRIMALVADRRGGMWVGTENAGLDYADPVTGRFIHHLFDPNTPSSIGSNSVQSLYLDATGALWVGTFSGGLDVSPLTGTAIESFRSVPGDASSLSYNTVPKFAESADGHIWVATDGGGLNHFDPATGRFVRYTQQTTNLNTDGVVGVVEGRRGDVWIGTWGGGLSELDPRRRVFTAYTTKNSTLPNDNVTEVFEDHAGRLWVGMDRAMVAVFDRARRTVTHRYHVAAPGADPVSPVWLVRELADGSMAIGLEDGGLTILDPATGAQAHYVARADDGTPTPANVRGTISGTDVRTLFEETPGMLWVGTNNGLDRLDLRSGTIVHYGEADGLPSRFIDGVLPDGMGRLWVSTDRGLARLDPRTRVVKLYGRPDGLQGNEFVKRAALRARDGTLYFGGTHGFNKVRPDELVENTRPPSVVITEFQLFNKPVRAGAPGSPLRRTIDRTDTLVVDHTQNVIGFEFAALDFSAPERNLYAYRLDGFDKAWQEVGAQYTASYTNLAPAEYTLRVRASNGDGVWTKVGATLVLVIKPPVWQTWWFRALAGALAACALFALWRFQQRRRLEVALGRQALVDSLTGLANRALFHDRVQHAVAQLARSPRDRDGQERRVAVLFLDLDGFKAVNDAMGHRAGDRLLQAVAARLLNATRGIDTVARFGGDEFAVLLANSRGLAEAKIVAERILSALRTPIAVGGNEGDAAREARVGASIGIALAEPGVNADALLAQADAAMYQAKSEGKGRQVVFHPALVAAAAEQHALESDLALALSRDEFTLAYQPIVAVDSGMVESVEALLRWHHPTRGLVPPSKFIPLAEASGLIVALGSWVLEEACRTAAGWPPGPTGARIGITVNVSGRQLDDPALPSYVGDALAASGLSASQLTLEITETVLMRNTEATLATLGALKALGIRLAIDDFGTGYSSLRYLQQFPVDVLKIDKSFVDGVARGGRDAALGRTIVALAETLSLRTVAEGIEDPEQRERLRVMGCDSGQGYLFARPLDAATLHALLTDGRCLGGPDEVGSSLLPNAASR